MAHRPALPALRNDARTLLAGKRQILRSMELTRAQSLGFGRDARLYRGRKTPAEMALFSLKYRLRAACGLRRIALDDSLNRPVNELVNVFVELAERGLVDVEHVAGIVEFLRDSLACSIR